MIRAATLDDVPAMVEMGRAFHTEARFEIVGPFDGDSFANSLIRWISAPEVILLVAEINGAVVGMTSAFLANAYFNEDWLIGQELFWWVRPEYRTGLGLKLANELEEEARARGVQTWGMACNENIRPEALKRFYRSRGYVPVERTFMKRL